MENCARPLPDAELEETITSTAAPSSTTDETSRFHSTFKDCLSSLDAISPGDRSGARSSPEPKSEYFSARVELMIQTEDQFPSDIAHEIAHSKVHWSQVTHRSDLSDDTDLSDDDTDFDSELVDLEYEGEVNRENELVFAELLNDPQWNHPQWDTFFRQWPSHLRLGRKVAEGGQAEICELVLSNGDVHPGGLVKVFKRGHRLSDLRRQWPHGILRREAPSITGNATMLGDGRFAFVMGKCWGDLRKLIDQAMRGNRGPPFPHPWNGKTWEARELLWRIAAHMRLLHSQGILHRDLKAANILLSTCPSRTVMVADFECSIGVVGTTFWRAPEILAAMRNRSAIEFSEKADVYSYGMTCFEVVTGSLPFEGELEICRASYDLVIEGRRPKLPRDVDEMLKALMEKCWDPIPSRRPTFSEICEILDNGYKEWHVLKSSRGACHVKGNWESVERDLVIERQRPKLVRGVDEILKALMERCWDPIPS